MINPELKKLIPTIIFYVVAIIIIVLLEKSGSGNVFGHNPGRLAFVILPIVCILLFLINISKTYKVDKNNKIVTDKGKRNIALIHLIISLILIAYILLKTYINMYLYQSYYF